MTKALAEARSPGLPLEVVEQPVQRGTGDAFSVALTAFSDDDGELDDLVVLPGDTPLLRPATLAAPGGAPRGVCRSHPVHRPAGGPDRAMAESSAPGTAGWPASSRRRTPLAEERAIGEVGTSIYVFRRSVLAPALRRLSPDNAQGEYYLTDVIAVLHDAGYPVLSMVSQDPVEANGVNDRCQLASAEGVLRAAINEQWMRKGVTMLDPQHTYLDSTVELAEDVTLFPGTILQGNTRVATGAEIGPSSHLVDCIVGARAQVRATSAEQVAIGEDAHVGPGPGWRPGP